MTSMAITDREPIEGDLTKFTGILEQIRLMIIQDLIIREYIRIQARNLTQEDLITNILT